MSFEEASKILINAKKYSDIFYEDDLNNKKRYREFIKICHPDIVSDDKKELAREITQKLNEFYDESLNPSSVSNDENINFDFEYRGVTYSFNKFLYSDDVCDYYEGVGDGKNVIIKIVNDPNDNDLLKNEYDILTSSDHLGLIKPLSKLKINGCVAIIYENINAYRADEIKKYYGNISEEHVCWILERLLSILGYLHSKKIVNGNIKPQNVFIDPDNHNVILSDFTFSISDADCIDKTYKIKNEYYSPSYVKKGMKVIPNVDIYATGKIAIDLLGGNVWNNGIPINVDIRLRNFIRKMLNPDSNDAWVLWDELINLRNEVYGKQRFLELRKKVL